MLGEITAVNADSVYLRHILRHRHERRHRTERLAQIVHIEAGHYHAYAPVCQCLNDVHEIVIKELGLIDTHNIYIAGKQQYAFCRIHRCRKDGIGIVTDNLFFGITGIDLGFEYLDVEICKLGTFQTAYEFLCLTRKHRTAYHFDPSGMLGVFHKHIFAYFCERLAKILKMSKLYIVPTPVGNLEDMTFRAVETLKMVDLILAEDTRTSSHLLKTYGITTHMESHHKFNEHQTVAIIRDRILTGMSVALISDAGTPGISDPGFLLVRTCTEAGIEVETLPGPTAFVPALINSGFPCDRFCFEGFLPVKKGRQTKLTQLASEDRTMIFYESPFRLVKTLGQFVEYFGPERKASVSREISKIHDTTHRGTLQELFDYFSTNEPKGEIVIVVSAR